MLSIVQSVAQSALGAIPAAAPVALSSLPAVATPGSSQSWFDTARQVSDHWEDGAANAAAASVFQAAQGSTQLEGNQQVIATAIAEGTAAIGAAIIDVGGIIAGLIAKVGALIASQSAAIIAGPAAPAAMAVLRMAIVNEALSALAAVDERLQRLADQLEPLTAALKGTVDNPVSFPPLPQLPGGLPGTGEISQLEPGSTSPSLNSGDGLHPGSTSTASVPQSDDEASDSSGGSESDTDEGTGSASPAALAAVNHAKSALGTPYQWGGTTPGVGMDCSGLTQWAYGQAGVDIPRTAADQAVGTQVRADQLQPGDLVVWDGHVAMVVGDGQMIEAGDPVQINPVRTSNMGMGFKGFYRPTG